MATPTEIWKHPIHFLSFGFGSGLARAAPGTVGTLAAVPVYCLFNELSLGAYLAVVSAAFVLGVWLCGRTARALGAHDHPAIVWDEFVGYWLVMAAVPFTWWTVLAGFLLFRLFDIAKPWPIRWVDRRVTGGFGIMLDDVLAAAPAWALLQILVILV